MEQIARTPKQLGNALRRQRRSRDLSQAELGTETNLRQATISATETGEEGTKLRTVFDILGALGLEMVIRPRTKLLTSDLDDLL